MTDQPERITFTSNAGGTRLDRLIVEHLGDRLSRSQIQSLIRDELITVDGATVKAGIKLKGGERIAITLPPTPADTTVEPEPIPLAIIHDDDEFAVINKPAGLIVHPGAGNESGTLVNALLARYPQIAEINYAPKRRGIVHRLDKDTSGVILVAKTARTMRRLMQQFQERTVDKTYLALVERAPQTRTGRIDLPLARDPNQRKRMKVMRDGKPAITEFTVIEDFKDGRALLRIRLLTGRTHQIRVHLAYLNAPIVGDRIYGYRKQRLPLNRQFLHAAALSFDHPQTGIRLHFESPLPDDLQHLLNDLRA